VRSRSPEPVSQVTPLSGTYDALSGRALAFVRDRGGSVHEDVLARHVFGNTGSAAIWKPLLRSVLAPHVDEIVLVGEHWALVRAASTSGVDLLGEFVAIDVETTGLRPRDQRMIEVALLRYRDGQLVERFESLLNPGREIPQFISTLTGIRQLDVDDAPAFDAVAEQVHTFIGDAMLVGHNIRFDVSFLNAELRRAGRESLINERLDTLTLARRYLPHVRKPSLDRVANALGIAARDIHRAGRDAMITAEAAIRLAEIACQTGVEHIDHLRSTGAPKGDRPRDDVGRARSVLDRSWLVDIPRKPGCYIMYGADDEVIYVGKAKSLRDRLSSYYSQPLGYTRKMDGLIESMTRVEVEVVGTELQALILESQLIQRYEPRYNTALRSFEHYPYIRVDIANPWPRVTLFKQRKDDGARYYGPYRSSRGARRTVDVITNAVPLRTCTRSFRNARSYGNPCLRLAIGKCLGPCMGQADREDYHGRVTEVIQFLDGEDDGLRARLWADLEAAAEALDFEKARTLRQELQAALALIEEQDRLRTSEIAHNLLLVQASADPEYREVLVVLHGQLWAQLRVARIPEIEIDGYPDESGKRPADDEVIVHTVNARASDEVTVIDGVRVNDLSNRLLAIMQRHDQAPHRPVDQYRADEANIINRWLFRNAGHPSIVPLDLERATDRGYLVTIALKVLSLTDEALERVLVDPSTGDEPAGEDDSDPEDDNDSVYHDQE